MQDCKVRYVVNISKHENTGSSRYHIVAHRAKPIYPSYTFALTTQRHLDFYRDRGNGSSGANDPFRRNSNSRIRETCDALATK